MPQPINTKPNANTVLEEAKATVTKPKIEIICAYFKVDAGEYKSAHRLKKIADSEKQKNNNETQYNKYDMLMLASVLIACNNGMVRVRVM